ncbi:MAG: hypothetical protein ABEH56_08865 [Salinirussus sp.]
MRPTRKQLAGIVTVAITALVALRRWRGSDDAGHDPAPAAD